MIRTVRAYFLSRFLREKILLTFLAIAIAAIWITSLAGRVSRFVSSSSLTSAALVEQAHWLSDKAAIEASAQVAASRLDPVKTLDTTRLLAEIAAIATETGLKNTTSGDPKDLSNGQFAVHTLQFNVTKVDWGALKAFYLELGKKSPYIGIEQFSVQVDRANPALLGANFQLSSVEISKN